MLVEVVEDGERPRVALQLDHDPHALAVGLVRQVGDAFQLAVGHQLGDLRHQVGLVHRVGELVDDDPLSPVGGFLEPVSSSHDDAAVAGGVSRLDAIGSHHDAARREVRALDEVHEVFRRRVRVVDQVVDAGGHLTEVMGRDVGGHSDRDAGGAVDEQVGDPGGQHCRLRLAGVVVGLEVDGVLVDVGQDLIGDSSQPRLRVPHRGSGVAVD